MRNQLFVFVIALMAMFSISRLLLSLWQKQRVQKSGNVAAVFVGGLRIDLNMMASFAVIPAALMPWFENSSTAIEVAGFWYSAWFLVSVFMELATPQFMMEYDLRPNRLFVEYLQHPKEVSTMLWRGYKWAIAFSLLGMALVLWLDSCLFFGFKAQPLHPWWLRIIESLLWIALAVACIRGTMKKRPINPSTVAFSSDGLVNSLALNSIYSLFYAIYAMKYEVSAEKFYGQMDRDEVEQRLRQTAGLESAPTLPEFAQKTSLYHLQRSAKPKQKPLNIVVIVEESLGAQYIGNLQGGAAERSLTPNVDKLYEQFWGFTNAYATGTRSVRGLEALSAGFPPTVSQSVFKLPKAQQGFFTIAKALGQQQHYHSRFVYGGEAHFDNMKSFFLGNGFQEVIDETNFQSTDFKGTWGYSDEDMFKELDRVLLQDHEQQRLAFTLAFSVSNHSPWEYPQGKITPIGQPASVTNTVQYADYAIGQFFEKAKQQPYWDNTVFLLVADHDSRVFGEELIPLKHFHIPAVIFGKEIAPRRDDRLISQIDLPVTLLSLAGVDLKHPMIGQDLCQSSPNRAIMQYDNRYGYLQNDQLMVLAPFSEPKQYQVRSQTEMIPTTLDYQFSKNALAHALWPFYVYKDNSY
ncbi:LTA synthase family protein [Brackiella oedipodis]|uniref:LTA synthase family protein n=1 Tax=Brackiella oedipodis TaxID=124225 RepID=UPI00048C964F|nr:LTA synthase family protein [Brackiella oedipodis]